MKAKENEKHKIVTLVQKLTSDLKLLLTPPFEDKRIIETGSKTKLCSLKVLGVLEGGQIENQLIFGLLWLLLWAHMVTKTGYKA